MASLSSEREAATYRPGVGIMLLSRDNLVFVGHRIRMPEGLARWQMPQGGIDTSETARQAALREIREEIGTSRVDILAESHGWFHHDVPDEIAIGIMGGQYSGNRQKWFAMRFTGADADINLATEHPEFDAWQWVNPEQLPELVVPFMRNLYLDVLAEFRTLWSGNFE
ncbi:MAG: RNA pyrophosphohydrolase [Alphaproteobacteria bacterium]|nr:RNA pyrophosphohydrolase [Alphaproteobacteria bacterium]